MAHIRTKMYSNGTTAITAATSSNPPYDFSAAKKGTVVARGVDFGNLDNTVVVDVYWGIRNRGFISTTTNITWVKDTDLTATVTASGAVGTAQGAFIPIAQMESPLMKVIMTPAGTSQAAKMQVYFEYET
jgi:hypothetical protein